MSLKVIEENLNERIEIEDAIKELKSLSPSESAIEKIVQALEIKNKVIALMLDDLDVNGYGKEELYNSYRNRAISIMKG